MGSGHWSSLESGEAPSCECARVAGCAHGGVVLRPPTSCSSCLYRRDGPVHAGRVSHPFLRRELVSLLQDLQVRALHLQVLRVLTALNMVANALSWVDPLNTEWTLPTSAFEDILRWAGPLEVDLMASLVNHRLPKWVSAFPHPGALAVDCQSFDWAAFGSLYLFPPTAMIPQLLDLILACPMTPVTLVVIVPWQPHETWFPPLFQRARGRGSFGTRWAPPHAGPLYFSPTGPERQLPAPCH